MEVIHIDHLCKQYGNKMAVNNVNIRISKGDIYGFIGLNGAGKSTILKMLCGLAHPTAGSIRLDGKPIKEQLSIVKIGAIIENVGVDPTLSAYNNMMLKANIIGLQNAKSQIDYLLEAVGIQSNEQKRVKKFSTGMQQRLGIALALLGDPEILILDEPINSLDPHGMRQIRQLLLSVNQSKGVTILISSHILGELEKMATKYGVLRNGELVQEITKEELHTLCNDYICIKVSNIKATIEILEKKLGITEYKIQDDGEIRIFSQVDTGKIIEMLVMGSIVVQSIYPHQQNLEEYFMNRMKGEV